MEELRTASRCILLFARAADEEARVKRLSRARSVFALARRRVIAAAYAQPQFTYTDKDNGLSFERLVQGRLRLASHRAQPAPDQILTARRQPR